MCGGLEKNVHYVTPQETFLTAEQCIDIDEVWFADVCPDLNSRDICCGLPFRVFDHHISNIRKWETESRSDLHFDITKCGTTILSEYLDKRGHGAPSIRLLTAIEDYDLWRKVDEGDDGPFLADLAAINPQRYFSILLADRDEDVFFDSHCRAQAHAVSRIRKLNSEQIAAASHVVSIFSPSDKHEVLVGFAVAPTAWKNSVADLILKRNDYRVADMDKIDVAIAAVLDPMVGTISLRSREGGPDCSMIAKAYGGGGHVRAAGFHLPTAGLLNTLSRKVLG
jgi:oligoribonuclease NrnB/cAMP/cGMP phosphodiesterase (DHH superfamily)